MTELEQLRNEVNELRERLARLEARHQSVTVAGFSDCSQLLPLKRPTYAPEQNIPFPTQARP